jgi:hypothetical protein
MSKQNTDYLDSPSLKLTTTKLTLFERLCRQICPCLAKKRDKAYRDDISRIHMNVGNTEVN